MQTAGNLLTRDDTFLGVCQGLGEDLGINPQYLRAALAVALFVNPLAVIAGYAALGLVVAGARWAFPVPQDAASAAEIEAVAGGEEIAAAAVQAPAEPDAEAVPLAA